MKISIFACQYIACGFWGRWGSLRGKKHLFAASKRGFFPLKSTVPETSKNFKPYGSVVLRPSGQMMLAHLAPESIQAEVQRRGNLLAASAETAQAFAQNGGLHALQSFPQRALRGHARFR